ARQVVTIGTNVERDHGKPDAFEFLEGGRQPLSQGQAARNDAEQAQLRQVRLSLDDLMRDPSPGAAEALGIENHGLSGWRLQHQRSIVQSRTAIRTQSPLRACRK